MSRWIHQIRTFCLQDCGKRARYPWGLTSGGPGSGLYVSRDGGDTWKQLTGKGLPDGIWGKVGVAVAPSDGRRVYALIEAESRRIIPFG